jgi:chromosome segregation protein
MRLKSLELIGFKSFLEPTTIGFSSGVTAVVGPNGCGKSNVVDAIRWILGEQAPTRLRGKSAEDLIYAGNDANHPAGMAEVTLILEAHEDTFPEPFGGLNEVAVTRRIYRSTDSEYLINRIPCRLKDITEFFMAAQIHSRGYALIEQGRIDEIIQAKPIELRAMVEEAAGLALFKGRREMSERKLERVRENLARVDDVISEIERQLNFARRQAKKAEHYKLTRSELSALEKLAAAQRLLQQHSELAEQSAHAVELREQSTSAHQQAAALQHRAGQAETALALVRDELGSAGRELETLRVAFEERARTRSFFERRLAALSELGPNLQNRLAELELKVTAARAARAANGARLARELNRDDGDGEFALSTLREQHQAADRTLRESEASVERLKDELSEVMREAAVVRGRLGDLAGERAELEQQLARLAVSTADSDDEVTVLRRNVVAKETAVAAARAEVTRCEAVQRETAEREIELRGRLEHQNLRVAAVREARGTAAMQARRLESGRASDTLRNVLESLNGDGPATAPMMLLDVMKAPPALEPALRAVLGEQFDAVVVDSPEFALRAIEILKQREAGRLSFIPESVIADAAAHEPIEAPGIIGRLLDMVEIEPRFASLVETLMGHVIVADDLRAALAASNLNGYSSLFVTREGDLLAPDKMISGGSGYRVEADAEIDMRKRLQALEMAEQAVVESEAAYEELLLCSQWARLAYQDDTEQLRAARGHVNQAEHAASDARAALVRGERQFTLAEANRANAQRRIAEIAELAVGANKRLEELARREQALRAQLVSAVTTLSEHRAAAKRLADAMLELAAKVEARKATLKAVDLELRHQRRIADELEAQVAQHRGEIERAAVERGELQRELATLEAQDQAASQRRSEFEAAVEDLTIRCTEREHELQGLRDGLTGARQATEALEAEAMQCELRCERARTLIEELERAFKEKFQIDFAAEANDLEITLSGRDERQDAERLQELRARAEKLGEVNLAAESEVQELEERAGALESERTDLRAAVNDLSHTIQKLNREARKRFAETFEGAARNFSELFPKLLRGGKGRLELTQADDVLDAGVNILVQPAGKKIKEIGLLSGGEKALSAMALIFSLFLLNPSPFCVMDEVDAPLDEFSLAAFTSLVFELKARSQFIVITHNQRTMQAADNIHGVTMERPGISRIVSLKIPAAA